MIAGCVQQYGEQSYNVGRNAWLQAGLPIETPATTIDRQCGSAQQAVNFAASLVASGVHDVVIGGGVEHMGHIPLSVNNRLHQELGSPFPQELLDRFPLVHQGLSAELIAQKWDVTREESDEIALRSQQRAARATEEGRFEREILPFPVNGDVLTTDQGIRPETTLEGAGRAEASVQGGRHDHRRQLVPGVGRRLRGAADVATEGDRARRHPARPDPSTTPPSASTRC